MDVKLLSKFLPVKPGNLKAGIYFPERCRSLKCQGIFLNGDTLIQIIILNPVSIGPIAFAGLAKLLHYRQAHIKCHLPANR